MLHDEHPINLELASLRAAVARFQEEAHSASVKLQRYSLDTSHAHDKIIHLERENALLTSEIDVLRRNTPVDAQSSQGTQVQELTLSLRRLSDKLDLTEESLLERTTELAHTNAELVKSKLTVDGAYALAARVRGREEEGLIRERTLEQQLWEAKEQTKQSDRVVTEYANLVRSLEGRTSTSSSSSPAAILAEGKQSLEKLFSEFAEETGRLQAEVRRLQYELEVGRAQCETEAHNSELDRNELAQIKTEIEKLRLEDNSAAKMVSRYMKFSQSSTNALQESLLTLKSRHSATVDTLGSQIAHLSSQLQHSRSSAEKMRHALDELGGDLMREAFGRRRETALRIRMISREEIFDEWVQRWIRRAEESGDLAQMIQDARNLETMTLRGSEERIAVVESTLQALLDDLRSQTDRRLHLEKLLAVPQQKMLPETPIPSPSIEQEDSTMSESSSSSTLAVSDSVVFPTKEMPLETVIDNPPTKMVFPIEDDTPTIELTPSSDSLPTPSMEEGSSVERNLPEVPPSLPSPHRLLAELSKVSRRYDNIQRAFRDCHLALQDLKQSLHEGSPILQTATERLNDYTEDARVELEIRIADEALQSQGFETLLSIGEVTAELEGQVEAFINGEDLAVKKMQKSLEHKLEDIEHDITAIKRALHDPELLSPVSPPPRPSSPSTFGNVITTRKLKHAQSTNFASKQSPYANLGLRVSMPQTRQPTGPVAMQTPRARTMSALYTLGLGRNTNSNGRLAPPTRAAEDDDDVE
ncbi:hypothetical protein BDZ89DRAFT_1056303 [Hymenopellis radicata]|nr:hypothetical protein BDZ89DRAFT_1056303 [Hymenopellis radicata]